MITQSITTAMTYLPSPSSSLPPSLALTILNALSKLSFIISQFGGVTSTSQGGFSELKRVFYSALDVLSVDAAVSEKFVMELCSRGEHDTLLLVFRTDCVSSIDALTSHGDCEKGFRFGLRRAARPYAQRARYRTFSLPIMCPVSQTRLDPINF